jgi:hypothetical protein
VQDFRRLSGRPQGANDFGFSHMRPKREGRRNASRNGVRRSKIGVRSSEIGNRKPETKGQTQSLAVAELGVRLTAKPHPPYDSSLPDAFLLLGTPGGCSAEVSH